MLCHDRLGVQPLHLVWDGAALLKGEHVLDLLLQLAGHFLELPSKCRPGGKRATDAEGSAEFETSDLHATFAAASFDVEARPAGGHEDEWYVYSTKHPIQMRIDRCVRSLFRTPAKPRGVQQQPFFKLILR